MNRIAGHFTDTIQRDSRGIVSNHRSVLQDWVMELPLREQGTLLTAIRGCDLTPKFPLDSIERQITGFVRCAVMVAFDQREIDATAGAFMVSRFPSEFSASALGHYPHHFVMHLIHALEIIARRCPHFDFGAMAEKAYYRFVHSMHLNPETPEQMIERLNEDRIERGTVVE